MRRVHRTRRVPGGHEVTIEVVAAYTDGRSRFDRVFVGDDEVADAADADGVLAVIARAHGERLRAVVGRDLDGVTPAPKRRDRLAAIAARLEAIEAKVDSRNAAIERGGGGV